MALPQQGGKVWHHLHVKAREPHVNLGPLVVLCREDGGGIVHLREQSQPAGNGVGLQQDFRLHGAVEGFPPQVQVIDHRPVLGDDEAALLQSDNLQLAHKGQDGIVRAAGAEGDVDSSGGSLLQGLDGVGRDGEVFPQKGVVQVDGHDSGRELSCRKPSFRRPVQGGVARVIHGNEYITGKMVGEVGRVP